MKKIKRAILTGATGAIGMALIRKLIQENVEVFVLCHRQSSRKDQLKIFPSVTIWDCSLTELSDFAPPQNIEFDIFYHLAWDGTFGPARNDFSLQTDNVRYTLDAVNLAHRLGCRRFVGIGSQAEYGRTENTLTPTTPAFPETGYGIAKLCAGQMSRLLAAQLKIEHIWIRVLSVYGPFDNPNSMVMSTIRNLYCNHTAKFTKAEQNWDYLHSDDAADAIFLLSRYGIDKKIYVLANGRSLPLHQFITTIQSIVAPDAVLKFGAIPYSASQVMNLSADISDIKTDTGWMGPKISFENGIKDLFQRLKSL